MKTLIFVWIFVVNLAYSQQLNCTGWFGSRCQYKCRCTQSCLTDGACATGDSCQTGWFGPACQYADLAYNVPVTVQPGGYQISSITDNNDTTCNTDTTSQSLTLTWNQTYLLTWMRVYTSNTAAGSLSNLTIQFSDNSGATYLNVTCDKNIIFNSAFMDIFCDLTVPVNQVVLTGDVVKSLCSLYISGGRNVALRQQTLQSSTYTDTNGAYGSEKAVDGDNSGNFTASCTCTTNVSSVQYWYTNISRPVTVYRYILYNRQNMNQNRLQGFQLTSVDARGLVLYRYTDSTGIPESVYTVVPQTPTLSVLLINIHGHSEDNYFTICEAEIYGDTGCVSGRYGRECENTCNCEKCYVSTGACISGCSVGYYGEACKQACPDGTYGSSCKHKCEHCASGNFSTSVCDRFNGTCIHGCQDGYIPTFCNQSCSEGQFGKNCAYNCPKNCVPNSHGISVCDNINGTCLKGCQDGYISSTCNQSCPSGKYGQDCSFSCSKFCASSSSNSSTCGHTDGSCLYGCLPGYDGARCDSTCLVGSFGQGCSSRCSQFCMFNNNMLECDHVTGTCSCQVGYDPPFCNRTCPAGTYGQDCKTKCSPHCVSDICHHINGTCECQNGYEVTLCSSEMHSPLDGIITGAVLGGVTAGVIGASCVAFICWRCRKIPTSQTVRAIKPEGVMNMGGEDTLSRPKVAEQCNMEINQKEPKYKRASDSQDGIYYNTLSDQRTVTQVNDLDINVYEDIP